MHGLLRAGTSWRKMNNSNWHLAGERTAQGSEGRDVGGPRPERLPGD